MAQPAHVTFIHGLANKPAPEELRRIWLDALGTPTESDDGFDLGAVGVTDSFVYWADLFYDEPIPPGEYESRSDELADSVPEEPALGEGEWVLAMLEKFPDEFEDAPVTEEDPGFERIPLPWSIKKRLMREFVREAHAYLFDQDGIRQTIRQRVLEDLGNIPSDTRHVLVGHSQGSFIAYDVLTGTADCKEIDGLMTLGSPLGVDEVQDRLVWTRDNGFPTKLRGNWVNVFDSLDVVARPDPKLANDFCRNGEKVVIDVNEQNWGTWRHSATKYFKGAKLRQHLRQLCGREQS